MRRAKARMRRCMAMVVQDSSKKRNRSFCASKLEAPILWKRVDPEQLISTSHILSAFYYVHHNQVWEMGDGERLTLGGCGQEIEVGKLKSRFRRRNLASFVSEEPSEILAAERDVEEYSAALGCIDQLLYPITHSCATSGSFRNIQR